MTQKKQKPKGIVENFSHHMLKCQKQPFRGVLSKGCSENMQQIYRRTPIPKCYFNKLTLSLL